MPRRETNFLPVADKCFFILLPVVVIGERAGNLANIRHGAISSNEPWRDTYNRGRALGRSGADEKILVSRIVPSGYREV